MLGDAVGPAVGVTVGVEVGAAVGAVDEADGWMWVQLLAVWLAR